MFNETLRIERIARTQGGRYYCKAENGVGVPAIKSIRVDVQCELAPWVPPRAQPGKKEAGGKEAEEAIAPWKKTVETFLSLPD